MSELVAGYIRLPRYLYEIFIRRHWFLLHASSSHLHVIVMRRGRIIGPGWRYEGLFGSTYNHISTISPCTAVVSPLLMAIPQSSTFSKTELSLYAPENALLSVSLKKNHVFSRWISVSSPYVVPGSVYLRSM